MALERAKIAQRNEIRMSSPFQLLLGSDDLPCMAIGRHLSQEKTIEINGDQECRQGALYRSVSPFVTMTGIRD